MESTKNYFNHMGEAFEEMKRIYDSLPKSSKNRAMIRSFTVKLAALHGEWQNLEAYWPEATRNIFSEFYHPQSVVLQSKSTDTHTRRS